MEWNIDVSNKDMSLLLFSITVLLSFVVYSFTNEVMDAEMAFCPIHDEVTDSCIHDNNVPSQTLYSGFLLSIMYVVSFVLFFNKPKKGGLSYKKINDLSKEEKDLLKLVEEDNGVIFQSDLVKKSNLTKVKISRIVSRLEAKGAIEKRRKGMSNLILLKKE